MARPTLAAIELLHRRKTYPYGTDNVSRLVEAGVGGHVLKELARLSARDAASTRTGKAAAQQGLDLEALVLRDLQQMDSDKLQLVVKLQEDRRRQGARVLIDELAIAAPGRDLGEIDFQFVWMGTPNAVAVHVKDDDSYAIGLDPSLHDLYTLLFEAAGVAHAVDDFRVFGSIAAQAVGGLYVHRPIEGFEENALLLREHTPPMVAQLADLLAPEAARFLLAHEVGHICLDHFARGHPSLLALHPDAPSRAVSAFDHELEFEADAWAAEATLQVAGDDVQRQTLAMVTPLLFFAMMAFVDRLHTTTSNPLGQTLRASHPSAYERLRRRWRFASEQTHIPPNDAMKLMVEIARFVEEQAPAPD